ncbi:MAG: VRR-NUC domain-containing protein [Cyclobacteriaceae bacterium]
MKTHPPIELPEKYYLAYFESVLAHVEKHYKKLLSQSEKSFIRRYRQLSEDAQCLFVRLVNRRGQYFRMDKIQYAEIEQPQEALLLLLKGRFFAGLSSIHAEEICDILHIFTKAELISLASMCVSEKKKMAQLRKLKKPELISSLCEEVGAAALIEVLAQSEQIIRLGFETEVEMIRFLFFGNLEGDMTQFVVRDIGYIKTEAYDQEKISALFQSRQEVEDKLLISRTYRKFKELRDEEAAEAAEIFKWFEQLPFNRESLSELAWPQYDKLCLRLGKLLEQQAQPEMALCVFLHTEQPPARERRVRLMHKLGQVEEALQLCQRMQESPFNADEHFFASDFCDRIQKKKRTRLATDYLRNSESIMISSEYSHQVEAAALQYYLERGQEGAFTENYLWRGCFGLLFWDIIFDQESEAIHHPLQTTPSDFYSSLFLQKRKKAIQKRLKVLHHKERFLNIVRHHHTDKMGMSNPMVGWHDSLLELVERVYFCLKPEQLAKVMLEMARDLRENSRGFPDLFVWDEKGYSFIEIKSPNDQLSAQQLYWLHFFEKQKINAKVLRVNWEKMAD